MSIPFSRSTRSLHSDRILPLMAIITISMLILLAWSVWFATAQVTLYEQTADIQIRRDGSLAATFPTAALARIRPGQRVQLYLEGTADEPSASIKGHVMDVDAFPQQGQGQIRIFLDTPTPPSSVAGARLDVEVEYASPLVLALRAAGQRMSGATLPADLNAFTGNGSAQ